MTHPLIALHHPLCTVNIFSVQLAGTDKLYVDSSGDPYIAAGAIASTSDRRLKSNITTIQGALHKVQRLRGVSFRYLNESGGYDGNAKIQLGFIAQEVQEVEPTIVTQPSSGSKKEFLHLDYQAVTPMLVEAMKELREEFTQETKALKSELESLRAQVEALRESRDESS